VIEHLLSRPHARWLSGIVRTPAVAAALALAVGQASLDKF
jgi:hypothetical protein